MISELNERSREIFRSLVDAYLETGEPVGSRTLSRRLDSRLSAATIRNVMADMEDIGLLHAPHASAGRMPTDAGLRLFVDGLLEIGDLTESERRDLDARVAGSGRSLEGMLDEAGQTLSGLSHCAGLVMAPKIESPLKHIEFVALSPGRALVVMVTESGLVENRILDVPTGLPPSALVEASNFLSARLVGRTVGEAQADILAELDNQRGELNDLTARVVSSGLATWSGDASLGALIVHGRAHLLEDLEAVADLERIRSLFAILERKETMLNLLELTERASGVQIFIGSENQLFGTAGCSLIVSPYRGGGERIVGAIGVIGPTRMNYARIIPMVDYTARVLGRILG